MLKWCRRLRLRFEGRLLLHAGAELPLIAAVAAQLTIYRGRSLRAALAAFIGVLVSCSN